MSQDTELVNWSEFSRTRGELGTAFLRILGYFREDGVKSISAVEDAFRARSAVELIRPAHTLKGESAQFGAYRLSSMAEEIEMVGWQVMEDDEVWDALNASIRESVIRIAKSLREAEEVIPSVNEKHGARNT